MGGHPYTTLLNITFPGRASVCDRKKHPPIMPLKFSAPRLLRVLSTALRRRAERVPPWGLAQLPNETIYEIVAYIDSPADIAHLCLAGHRLYYLVFPKLYASVEAKSMRLCLSALTALSEKPYLANAVETLSITSSFEQEVTLDGLSDEKTLADIIRRIAPSLYRLRAFIWNGFESPTEGVWLALRKHCPLLKSIRTSIGKLPINHDSHLYDFEDLTSFTYAVTWHQDFSIGHAEGSEEDLPLRLWKMLYRSTNLQSLTIGGPARRCPRFLDVRPLTRGYWPKLTTLSLGDTLMRYQLDAYPCHFAHFLHRHPSLQALHLPGTRHFTQHIFIPEPTFLPHLTAYTASLMSLSSFPLLPNLTTLRLTTEEYAYWVLPLLTWTLVRLPSLTSFSIWLDFSEGATAYERDHCQMLEQMLPCCCGLEFLEILCSTNVKYTFRFEDLAPLLDSIPYLKRLVIQKVHKATDIDMLESAVQLVRSNRYLQHVTLRSTEGRWFKFGPTYVRKTGMYTVVRDPKGEPVRLRVYESGLKLFGRSDLHYDHELVPKQNWPKVLTRKGG